MARELAPIDISNVIELLRLAEMQAEVERAMHPRLPFQAQLLP
jgi:hypothetical protein